MTEKNIIVAASRNKHKIEEIEAITKKFGMKMISRDEAGVPPVKKDHLNAANWTSF